MTQENYIRLHERKENLRATSTSSLSAMGKPPLRGCILLSSHLHLHLPSGLFPSVSTRISHPLHAFYMLYLFIIPNFTLIKSGGGGGSGEDDNMMIMIGKEYK
jgi:hypothetical protein